MRRLIFLSLLVVCGTGCNARSVSETPQETIAATPEPTRSPTAKLTPEPEPVVSSDLHDAPELEALLPAVVAGQALYRWSALGINYFGGVGGLADEELATLEADLATEGFTIDDFSQGTAGRSDLSDRPYLILVFHVRGVAATDLPLGMHMDNPQAGAFEQIVIAGKQVRRGVPEMIEQTDHARGTPYVYASGEYLFTILTEDEEWAADALAQLP